LAVVLRAIMIGSDVEDNDDDDNDDAIEVDNSTLVPV